MYVFYLNVMSQNQFVSADVIHTIIQKKNLDWSWHHMINSSKFIDKETYPQQLMVILAEFQGN